MKDIREISVFVDESGSFDATLKSSPCYLVCMVFHDQSADIRAAVQILDAHLRELYLPEGHAVHAGPLIRWESPYRAFRRQERRVIFSRMMAFLRHCDVTYRCFSVDKRFVTGLSSMHEKLLSQIREFLAANVDEFSAFDRIKVYYDNGQSEVLHLLEEAFSLLGPRVCFVPGVTPEKYRLFQLADVLASLELIRLKLQTVGRISPAEKDFFLGIGNLRKNFLKPAQAKMHA